MPLKPSVLDLSSHNDVASFADIAGAGIQGVILKATQSTRFVDKTYASRVAAARRAGLLVAAYHFASGADVDDQVAHFLEIVGEAPDVLLCLDYEPNPNGSTMSLEQAKQFLRLVRARTGQRPLLYSGHLIKEQLGRKADPFLAEHRLWLAHYGVTKPTLPAGWSNYWLWQYSDQISGFPGIKGGNVDVNVFGGTNLALEWIDRPPSEAEVSIAHETSHTADEREHFAIPAADGEKPEKSSYWDGWSFAKVNELADQGSRLAQHLRGIKVWFWRLLFGTTVAGGSSATLMDTSKGNGHVVASNPHLVWMLGGIAVGGLLIAGLAYLFVKFRIEPGLVSAARDRRYRPRGAQSKV